MKGGESYRISGNDTGDSIGDLQGLAGAGPDDIHLLHIELGALPPVSKVVRPLAPSPNRSSELTSILLTRIKAGPRTSRKRRAVLRSSEQRQDNNSKVKRRLAGARTRRAAVPLRKERVGGTGHMLLSHEKVEQLLPIREYHTCPTSYDLLLKNENLIWTIIC